MRNEFSNIVNLFLDFVGGILYDSSYGVAEKTCTLYDTGNQLRVIISIALTGALNINAGDKVMWVIDRGELVLRKV